MNIMKIANFITLDEGVTLKSLKIDKRKYRCANSGIVYFPIGVPLPIISKRQGCIGIGVPVSVLMSDNNNTFVTFTFTELDSNAQKVFYNLYKTTVGMSMESGNDIYDENDFSIPGLATGIGMDIPSQNHRESDRERSKINAVLNGHRSLSIREDDDYDA